VSFVLGAIGDCGRNLGGEKNLEELYACCCDDVDCGSGGEVCAADVVVVIVVVTCK